MLTVPARQDGTVSFLLAFVLAAWVVVARSMSGMGGGSRTLLGSFPSFS